MKHELTRAASAFAARVQERNPEWFRETDTDFAKANAELTAALLGQGGQMSGRLTLHQVREIAVKYHRQTNATIFVGGIEQDFVDMLNDALLAEPAVAGADEIARRILARLQDGPFESYLAGIPFANLNDAERIILEELKGRYSLAPAESAGSDAAMKTLADFVLEPDQPTEADILAPTETPASDKRASREVRFTSIREVLEARMGGDGCDVEFEREATISLCEEIATADRKLIAETALRIGADWISKGGGFVTPRPTAESVLAEVERLRGEK